MLACGPLPAAAAGVDYFPRQIPRPAAPAGRVAPLHAYLGATPAYWPQPLHWRYNPAGAPGPFSDDDAATIQQLIDASGRWMAACGVAIVYDGDTEAPPDTLVNGRPDLANVIGWKVPEDGFQAVTHYWTDVAPNGDGILVDADISLSPTTVTTREILASIITHEWGHAIGLGHSPVADTLMSGPPDSAYTGGTELTPDDVQGCRCLYGPPPGVQRGLFVLAALENRLRHGNGRHDLSATRSRVHQRRFRVDDPAQLRDPVQARNFAFANNRCSSRHHARAWRELRASNWSPPPRSPISAGPKRSSTPRKVPIGFRCACRAWPRIAAAAAPPPNFEGAWWHAPAGSESGWGITLAHQGDLIFAAWYTYDADGKAWWLTMTAVKIGNNTYSGTLYRTTGPAFDATPFDPNQVQRIQVGSRHADLRECRQWHVRIHRQWRVAVEGDHPLRLWLDADLHVRHRGRSCARHELPGRLVGRGRRGIGMGHLLHASGRRHLRRAGSPTISTARRCGCRRP